MVDKVTKTIYCLLKKPKIGNCAVLDYYAASTDNLLPTFSDNLSFPFSRVQKIHSSYTITF